MLLGLVRVDDRGLGPQRARRHASALGFTTPRAGWGLQSGVHSRRCWSRARGGPLAQALYYCHLESQVSHGTEFQVLGWVAQFLQQVLPTLPIPSQLRAGQGQGPLPVPTAQRQRQQVVLLHEPVHAMIGAVRVGKSRTSYIH